VRVIGSRTLAFVAVLLALEWLAASAGYGKWAVMEQTERLGWRMLPDQDALSRELDVGERVNAYGFRDRAWAPSRAGPDGVPLRDPRVFRVAIVGNSIAYGMGVPIEETFGRVLERRLAERFAAAGDPRQVLVMNFSVQGYVFEQMARVYEDVIAPFAPDVLVVPHHPHDIAPMAPAADDPEYDLRTLVLRTALYDWLNRHVIDRWIAPVPPTREARTARLDYVALEEGLRRKPFAREYEAQWRTYFERLEELRRAVQADGGRLALVALPRWLRLLNDRVVGSETRILPWARSRADADPPGVVPVADPFEAFAAATAALIAEIRERGIDVTDTIDLRGRLARLGVELEHAGDNVFLAYDLGHYSARGHALIGEVLLAALDEAGWVP